MIIQLFTSPQSLVFIQGQAAFGRQQNRSLHIICADGPELAMLAQKEGFTYNTVPFRREIRPFRDVFCLLKTYWLLCRISPQVVHVNTPKAAFLGLLAAKLACIPVRVYEIHGLPFETRQGLTKKILIKLERLMCYWATDIWAVSNSVRIVANRHRINANKPIRVPAHGSCNGVDAQHTFNPARFSTRQRQQLKEQLGLSGSILGFVGRITREKGLTELTDAWQKIRSQYPHIGLLIVGQPDIKTAADYRCFTCLLADSRVCSIGHVTDVATYLSLMDVLLLPTHREGFGNILIEAAAMNVPVVASRVTGVIDAVVDQETGLLYEPYSVEGLSACICQYLDNPDLRHRHGQQARSRVLREFVPETIWKAKNEFYQYAYSPHPHVFSTLKRTW